MPKYPNVGEYWYIKTYYDDKTAAGFRLAYCIARIGENSVMQIYHSFSGWQSKYDIMKSLDRPEMKPASLRRGQFLMNMLFYINPDIYNTITATEADCFYDDRKIPAFFSALSCSTDPHDLPEITREIEKLQSSLKQTITRMLQEYLSVSPEIQSVWFSGRQAYVNINGFNSECKDGYILHLRDQWIAHGNGETVVV